MCACMRVFVVGVCKGTVLQALAPTVTVYRAQVAIHMCTTQCMNVYNKMLHLCVYIKYIYGEYIHIAIA